MSKHSNSSYITILIHFIIFLSGFSFLVYEVSWNRILSLALGDTVSASTIVITVFMIGFSIGAHIFGKIAHASSKTSKLLSFLLIGIGLFGFIDYYLLNNFLPSLYPYLSNKKISALFTELIVYGLSITLLLLQTSLMGGFLPVVSKIAIKTEDKISSGLGQIYALETLGSASGGLLAGFWLLGNLGQQNTIILSIGINLISGLFLLLNKTLIRSNKITIPTDKPDPPKPSKKQVFSLRHNFKLVLPATFVFGFSIMALQVIWIRIYKIYLTNTSYTFALISSLVIVGFFVGSYLFKKYSPKIKNHSHVLFRVLLLFALAIGMGLFVLANMPEFIMFPFKQSLTNPFIKLIIMPMVAAIFVVFPPSVISGFAFPLACRLITSNVNEVSRGVGKVLTINSIGSAAGPLFAGFIFIPAIGTGLSVFLILFVVVGLSVFFIFQLKTLKHLKWIKLALISASMIFLFIVFFKPKIKILPPSFSMVAKEILFYQETVEASLVVSRETNHRSEVKTAYVNNAVVMGSTYDAIKAVKMIGHLPFLAGLDCKEVLIVGFGIGITTSTIAAHPEVKSIDCVELAGGLKNAAKFFKDLNGDIINDPRLNFITGDGRHFLQRTHKKYDLISSDPTHPILGSANLYSQEYFELCKAHLTEGGMVSQYLPLHKLRPEDFQGIIKTFQSVFTEATVWLGHTHAILIGSNKPFKIDFRKWKHNTFMLVGDPLFYSNPYHLAACLMLDKSKIENFGDKIKLNTDNLSYLEFFSPDCFDENNLNKNIEFLSKNRTDINSIFLNIYDPVQLNRFITGNDLFIQSSIHFQNNEKQKALEDLRKAVKANPENEEYPFLIKFYFGLPK